MCLPDAKMKSGTGSGSGPSVAAEIVEQVASAKGVDHSDLPPLYETLDPAALDRLVASLHASDIDGPTVLAFRYAGYRVAIAPDGDVTVTPSAHTD